LEIKKGRMTAREVGQALGEYVVPEDHKLELKQALKDKFDNDQLYDILNEMTKLIYRGS